MTDNECQLHIHFCQFLMETFPNTDITVCGNFSKKSKYGCAYFYRI